MSTRLKDARAAVGLIQDEVAEAVGKSRSLVSQWESGDANPTPEDWITLSDLYGRSIDYLMAGRDNRPNKSGGNATPANTKLVPLIDYVSAGAWGSVVNPFENGDGFEFVVAEQPTSDLTFALKVEGDSMSPEFRPGSVIIVDPTIQPNPGDMVVAKLDREEAATFKKYRPRGIDKSGQEVIELVPLNPDWPTLVIDSSNPGRIVGTVVGHLRKLR
jgi:SOS-response transcriptional repressor LexA